eukprot:gnl/MRDRNA2_/MRDRNA2_248702_c0_seq1.p1 gnl/MRDRNA2_/MRDRNA2_248702_c0~~gnl/MRDRNA2_/MRDRNA2_248702_c0_seq1.p1  ORF type:complete len:296 (+),score=30.22 gnl/MRDRNA2_/MRDRNA2_248702_c0_seq1:81-968(+)
MMCKILLVAALSLVASKSGVSVPQLLFSEACNGTSSTICPNASQCCNSPYSPSKFGCSIAIGNLSTVSAGCGDGLPTHTTLCCKPGPPLPPSTTLPNVLIIGDSVSIGYTTLATKNVVKLLSDMAQVQHGPWDVSDGGAGDTATGVACLDLWLMTQSLQWVKWDLITFNFGLHDMTDTPHCLKLYRDQLTNITKRLVMLDTKLLYITTTPYMPYRTLNNTVVEDMNAIAKTLTEEFKIPNVDLYSYVTQTCGEVYRDCPICRMHPCSAHYNDVGMNAQAKIVAAAIQQELGLTEL